MDSFTLGHAKFHPNQSGIIYPSDMSTDEVVKQGVLLKGLKRKQKLEQYAWEVYKKRITECAYTDSCEHTAEFAYEFAEGFLKYTEEKFNEA